VNFSALGVGSRPSTRWGSLATIAAEATAHLFELGRPRTPERGPEHQVNQISPDVLRLLTGWDRYPAFVTNQRFDVLGQNPIYAAFHEGFTYTDNLLRLAFLDPMSHELYLDWEAEASSKVAHLRTAAGADCDPALFELVKELSRASELGAFAYSKRVVSAAAAPQRS
jgi:hypothetical protein